MGPLWLGFIVWGTEHPSLNCLGSDDGVQARVPSCLLQMLLFRFSAECRPAIAFCPDLCWLHRARVTSFTLGGAREGGWELHVVKVSVPMCFCCIANTYSWILCFFTQKQIGLARQKWSFRSSNSVCVCVFNFGQEVCGILVPQPGLKPRPSAVKVPSPKLWTTGEVPILCVCIYTCIYMYLYIPIIYLFGCARSWLLHMRSSCGVQIFSYDVGTLSSTWHLVPWPGMELGSLPWESETLATGPLRSTPLLNVFNVGHVVPLRLRLWPSS